ncbi:MAG TPA: glycoside hydrolase family 3 N-terminal domain-containing protein [Rugosimonospora sp.]
MIAAAGTGLSEAGESLSVLAETVLQPGFEGTTAPDWIRRRIARGLGGAVLFGRNIVTPEQVAALTAQLRAENPDLIIAIDEETGDVTRVHARTGSTRPGNYALAAIDDPELTEAVARDLGGELAHLGVSLNYAPSADVNSNPDNPVIGARAFGSDPAVAARHVAAWVRGQQSVGVGACAKHFPGHGDTQTDSHHGVPLIDRSRDEMRDAELVPFRAAIAAGVRAVMTGHLLVPALDPDHIATHSPAILQGLLRDELGFTGLVISDGIEMAASAARYGLGGASARAIAAGVDAICVGGENSDEATVDLLRDSIVAAVHDGSLPLERLAEAAARVRAYAGWSAACRDARAAHRWTDEGTIGRTAARRALRVHTADGANAVRPLTVAPHVVEFAATVNLAVGPTPWGLAEPLRAHFAGTTVARLGADGPVDGVLRPALDRPLVVVVRDVHRHQWMADRLAEVVRLRPDAVVVEMGIPVAAPVGGTHIATFGAARACGEAAAELLAGRQ